jgi:hypothetical protein
MVLRDCTAKGAGGAMLFSLGYIKTGTNEGQKLGGRLPGWHKRPTCH